MSLGNADAARAKREGWERKQYCHAHNGKLGTIRRAEQNARDAAFARSMPAEAAELLARAAEMIGEAYKIAYAKRREPDGTEVEMTHTEGVSLRRAKLMEYAEWLDAKEGKARD